jgi:hypothetical protein
MDKQIAVITAFVLLTALSIPFGLGMAFYTGNSYWLFFCVTLVMYL